MLVPVEDLAEDAEDVLIVAHVALVDAYAPVGVLVGELPGVVMVGRVAGRHRDAAVEQPLADGQPNAAGPAGNHRDLPVHVTHGVPPMLSVGGPESAGHVLARPGRQIALPHCEKRRVLAPHRVREPLVALRHVDRRLYVHARPCQQLAAAHSRPLGEKVPVCRARTQHADSKLIRHQPGLGPAKRPGFPARGIHGHRIG